MIHLRFTWLHGGGVRLQKKLQASRDIYKDRLFLCACYVIVPILRTRYRLYPFFFLYSKRAGYTYPLFVICPSFTECANKSVKCHALQPNK